MAASQETDLEQFVAWLWSQGLSPNTIDQRRKFARSRMSEWGALEQSPEVIAQWLSRFNGWTRRTYDNHLRSICAWLIETGRLDVDPMKRIRPGAIPRPDPHPVSEEDADRLDLAATGDLRAWLMLARYAGLRCHEIAKIRGEDVSAEMIRVVGKGGQLAMVPTHPEVWWLAQRYPRQGLWFPSPMHPDRPITAAWLSQRVRSHFAALGLDGGIHRLRATYGTSLLRNGANIKVVQDLMRHRSLSSTEHYLGVDESERRRAIRSLRPTPYSMAT